MPATVHPAAELFLYRAMLHKQLHGFHTDKSHYFPHQNRNAVYIYNLHFNPV